MNKPWLNKRLVIGAAIGIVVLFIIGVGGVLIGKWINAG